MPSHVIISLILWHVIAESLVPSWEGLCRLGFLSKVLNLGLSINTEEAAGSEETRKQSGVSGVGFGSKGADKYPENFLRRKTAGDFLSLNRMRSAQSLHNRMVTQLTLTKARRTH